MPRCNYEGAEYIYQVAERFKETALLATDSLLTPGRPVWTAESLEELHQRFVLQPDTSKLSFEQKLAKQLTDASDDAIQLMAEIILVHLLINIRISGKRKRELLKNVLRLGKRTAGIETPEAIDRALDYGISWPGMFFNTGRDRQLRFLIEWMRAWRQLAPEGCARLLADPWAFKDHLNKVEAESATLQRNVMLHLLFPDVFERAISPEHRSAIIKAFAKRIGGLDRAKSLDEDRALLEIRSELAKQFGPEFDYYDTPEVAAAWKKPPSPPTMAQPPLLDRVLAYYPDWTGFSDPRYLKEERDYKVKASELAMSLLGREPLGELIAQGRQQELIGRIEQVAHATNLLWTNVPRAGDLAILYRQQFHLPSFTEALFHLLHGEGDGPERLDRFFAYTTSQSLPTKWALPTYLLMLLSPETDFFVKPEMTRWFLREVSSGVDLPSKPSGEVYRRVLDVVTKLRDDLVAYEPSDFIDIQGYIWVASRAPSPKKLGKPFDEIFPDWDTAWWAFDVLREGLGRLGLDAAGDNRVAVSLPGRTIHVSFASWLLFGFGREKNVPQAGIVPLRAESPLFPEARVSGPFAADSSVNLRYLPVTELRQSWDAAQPEVEEALVRVRELFSTHVATPFRRHNRPELEAAVFDESAREKLFKEGLLSTPAAADSVYGHLASTGFHFPDWLVTDYVLSLAAKPFVILSGISGTGKTKMAQLVSGFIAPELETEVVVAPRLDGVEDGFTAVEVRQSAISHRRLTIPAELVEGFAIPEAPSSTEFVVKANGETFPARLYVHPSGHNVQVHMKPELYGWFGQQVRVGDYIGMKVIPLEEGVPDFELEIRTLPVERRTEKRPSARVAFLSVRPDWTDNRGLLGYYNPLMREYAATELLRLLLRAHAHRDEPHFVILDEMNLAKVEYYFSDFLSAMESGTAMRLHDVTDGVYVDSDEGSVLVPPSLTVPENVFFTGTVNVDETTYMFSPKVLDRANTIEFNEVRLESYGTSASWDSGEFRLRDDVKLEDLLRQQVQRGKPQPEDWTALPDGYKERLRSLHALMESHNMHFGYRVANEVARYLLLAAKYVGEDQLETAFDLQILQKVLPKLAGNRARLYQPMRELLQWCIEPDAAAGAGAGAVPVPAASSAGISVENARYPRSAVKLKRMLETLETVGFVSFVE